MSHLFCRWGLWVVRRPRARSRGAHSTKSSVSANQIQNLQNLKDGNPTQRCSRLGSSSQHGALTTASEQVFWMIRVNALLGNDHLKGGRPPVASAVRHLDACGTCCVESLTSKMNPTCIISSLDSTYFWNVRGLQSSRMKYYEVNNCVYT